LNTRNDILVVNQRGNAWSLPKGHIDPGEDARTAAEREIYEESGVSRLTFIKPLGGYERFRIGKGGIGEDRSELKHIEIFLFRTDEEELSPKDELNPEARWVAKDKVASLLTHPKDKEFFQKILFEIPS